MKGPNYFKPNLKVFINYFVQSGLIIFSVASPHLYSISYQD